MMFIKLICLGATFLLNFGLTGAILCYKCTSFYSRWCEDPFIYNSPLLPTKCTIPPDDGVLLNLIRFLHEDDDEFLGAEDNLDRRRRSLDVALTNSSLASSLNASGLTREELVQESIQWTIQQQLLGMEDVASGYFAMSRAVKTVQKRYAPIGYVAEIDNRTKVSNDFVCYKVVAKGTRRNETEVFRGCVQKKTIDICRLVTGYNDKGNGTIKFCNTCKVREDNPKPGEPEVYRAPCNSAATLAIHVALVVLSLGVCGVLGMRGLR